MDQRGVLSACLAVCWTATTACVQVPRAAEPGLAPIDAESVRTLFEALPTHRTPGSVGHEQAVAYLERELQALGLELRRDDFEIDVRPDQSFSNLEARTRVGSERPLLLVGAHFDSVPGSPGADDNGSGVVATLAVARRLATASLPIQLGFVFFDAEEIGLVGSRVYADALSEADRERLIGFINLETLGYRDLRPGSQTLPPGFELLLDPGDVGDFITLLANVDSQALAASVELGLSSQAAAGLRTVSFDVIPGEGWMLPDTRRSDHASFWDIGVPALMLTDTANFRNPNYHRPSDALSTLDLEFVALVARGVERAILAIAEDY